MRTTTKSPRRVLLFEFLIGTIRTAAHRLLSSDDERDDLAAYR